MTSMARYRMTLSVLVTWVAAASVLGQTEILVEDFEFALDDVAAARGIEDLTDFINCERPSTA